MCRPYGMAWAARPGGRALRASCSTEDRRPHGAAPTVETDRPYNQGRSPHPSRPAASPPTPFGLRPFPPDRGNRPSPKGEGFRAADSRPYGGKRPRTLVRKRQAQKRNRSNFNFLPAQAPSGAGWDRPQALLILRAGNVLLTSRGNPRIWGPGKAVLWT